MNGDSFDSQHFYTSYAYFAELNIRRTFASIRFKILFLGIQNSLPR